MMTATFSAGKWPTGPPSNAYRCSSASSSVSAFSPRPSWLHRNCIPAFFARPTPPVCLSAPALPLSSAGATGFAAGMTATHSNGGTLTIRGAPPAAGSFRPIVTATDSAAGTLNTSLSLSNIQVASNATASSAGSSHSCFNQRRGAVLGSYQQWPTRQQQHHE